MTYQHKTGNSQTGISICLRDNDIQIDVANYRKGIASSTYTMERPYSNFIDKFINVNTDHTYTEVDDDNILEFPIRLTVKLSKRPYEDSSVIKGLDELFEILTGKKPKDSNYYYYQDRELSAKISVSKTSPLYLNLLQASLEIEMMYHTHAISINNYTLTRMTCDRNMIAYEAYYRLNCAIIEWCRKKAKGLLQNQLKRELEIEKTRIKNEAIAFTNLTQD
jgi:hypothetical protein